MPYQRIHQGDHDIRSRCVFMHSCLAIRGICDLFEKRFERDASISEVNYVISRWMHGCVRTFIIEYTLSDRCWSDWMCPTSWFFLIRWSSSESRVRVNQSTVVQGIWSCWFGIDHWACPIHDRIRRCRLLLLQRNRSRDNSGFPITGGS